MLYNVDLEDLKTVAKNKTSISCVEINGFNLFGTGGTGYCTIEFDDEDINIRNKDNRMIGYTEVKNLKKLSYIKDGHMYEYKKRRKRS